MHARVIGVCVRERVCVAGLCKEVGLPCSGSSVRRAAACTTAAACWSRKGPSNNAKAAPKGIRCTRTIAGNGRNRSSTTAATAPAPAPAPATATAVATVVGTRRMVVGVAFQTELAFIALVVVDGGTEGTKRIVAFFARSGARCARVPDEVVVRSVRVSRVRLAKKKRGPCTAGTASSGHLREGGSVCNYVLVAKGTPDCGSCVVTDMARVFCLRPRHRVPGTTSTTCCYVVAVRGSTAATGFVVELPLRGRHKHFFHVC